MSRAHDLVAGADWAATTTIGVPGAGRHDARTWAEAIFDARSVPAAVKVLFGLREVLARILRIPRGEAWMLAVDRVDGPEAIVDTDDRHLHFVAATSVDAERDLVHVVTVVQLKGWRGRAYFLPVRLLHDPVTRAMMKGAARRLAADPAG